MNDFCYMLHVNGYVQDVTEVSFPTIQAAPLEKGMVQMQYKNTFYNISFITQ